MVYTVEDGLALIYNCYIIRYTSKAVEIKQGYDSVVGWIPISRAFFRRSNSNERFVQFKDLLVDVSREPVDVKVPKTILNNNIPSAQYYEDIPIPEITYFGREAVLYKCMDALGVEELPSTEELKSIYRKALKKSHPDMEGGSREKFDNVQKAYDRLLKYIQQRNL